MDLVTVVSELYVWELYGPECVMCVYEYECVCVHEWMCVIVHVHYMYVNEYVCVRMMVCK